MSTKIRVFEFIERPGSLNKRPQGSRPMRIWSVLRKHHPFLKSAENEDITLFNESLRPNTNLSSLDVGKDSDTTIIVRYPLSRLSMNLRFVNNRKEECKIKHTTGSFNMLQVEAKSKFESLADCKLNDIYFEHQGEKIGNAYNFELLVENLKKWLEEVLKNIYNYKNIMLELVSDDFNLEGLPQLSQTLSDEGLNTIIEQLKVKESMFDNTNTNEAIAREFISVILVNAVYFVKKNIDNTATLMVEKQLAKLNEPGKGIAQNLAQIDSAYEENENLAKQILNMNP
ncbi:10875_t:CDS:2 [Funneliformis geosporum]|uniref:10875_t:CDS:1 n=1 Tax=Funneliformis geosporum TaxID=1117311 RepID=A0A9W4SML8_9GLOM|nr:10875_t:CDS:2 [Funneliformis geosporum]